MPTRLERTLRLIAPAVLAAIIANGLVLDQGRLNPRVSWYAGTLVAVFIVRRFRSAAWAMAVAMVVVCTLHPCLARILPISHISAFEAAGLSRVECP